MANGILGKAMSVANSNVKVYEVPGNVDFATVSVNCCNTGMTDASVKIAIGLMDTPGQSDFIEFGAVIPANGGILERACVVCSANEKIIVHSNSGNVAVRVYGLEQV